MKKLFKIGILTMIAMFSLAIVASASEAVTNVNVGVSEDAPVGSALSENLTGEITPFGLNPPTSVHNLNSGMMEFSGAANRSPLYSDTYFTGSKNVHYNIWNYHDKDLTVKVMKKNGVFAVATLTIRGNTGQLSMLNLDASAEYYLVFSDPSNFYGSVYK